MKTKKYIAPKIEVIEIETEEVISSSERRPSQIDNQWGSGNGLKSTDSTPLRTNFNGN